MKKIGISFFVFLGLTIFMFAFLQYRQRLALTAGDDEFSAVDQERLSKTYSVAILLPISHPALEEIQEGFVDSVSQELKISYDVYNGNGDRMLMRAQADEVIRKGYDLVCTIASSSFLIFYEVALQRNSTIPIVGCAVDTEQIAQFDTEARTFTIVSDIYDFTKQLNVLLALHPTKRIILPYNVTPGLEKQVALVRQECAKRGIELVDVKIYAVGELLAKVGALLSEEDEIIMVLKDNVVVSGIESLISLARRKHKPLYVSDLNSVDKGAVFGFGVYEYDMGVAGGNRAIEILRHQKKPSELAYLRMKDFKLKINPDEFKAQSVFIDKTLLFFMKSTLFVGGTS